MKKKISEVKPGEHFTWMGLEMRRANFGPLVGVATDLICVNTLDPDVPLRLYPDTEVEVEDARTLLRKDVVAAVRQTRTKCRSLSYLSSLLDIDYEAEVCSDG